MIFPGFDSIDGYDLPAAVFIVIEETIVATDYTSPSKL